MITDILTVAAKELREIFTFGDVRGRSKFSLLVLIVIFGVVIPLQNGREWVTSPANAMVWAWMPFLWVSGVVADLFAGERERHTLEALLATRLSDQAILFGKITGGDGLWLSPDLGHHAGQHCDIIFILGLSLAGIWIAALVRGAGTYVGTVIIPSARYAYPAIIPTLLALCTGWLELGGRLVLKLHIPAKAMAACYVVLSLALDIYSLISILSFYDMA